MTKPDDTADSAGGFGILAYLGAGMSLAVCFWTATFSAIAPLVGLAFVEINPHLQAIIMWLFGLVTVGALAFDRRRHGAILPLMVGVLALVVIVGTLYLFYHTAILATGYVLLLVAAFLNQHRMLSALNEKVQVQAADLESMNNSLERQVEEQVAEIERLASLKRFLSSDVADLITREGKESLLQSHRRYIACLFCDMRRFTAMTENMEPEDVMDILGEFHAEIGERVTEYGGTIGYRAGDGVMAFFNDPIPCDDPDLRAVRLALDLRDAFTKLREHWAKLGADIGFGIGIAGGYATMGVIGTEGRMDYTPIGNAVNVASRLSDHAQDGEILINRRSWAEVEESVASQSAGTVSLKGMSQPVEVYRLEGLREDARVVSLAEASKKSSG